MNATWQAEMLQRGVLAEAPPVHQPWGNRELRVRDPDGNQLCICSVLREAASAAPGDASQPSGTGA